MNCKKIITTALFTCLLILSVSFSGNSQALSSRIANYDMKVKLDPVEKIIDGTMTFEWKNPSQDTIRELHFHMYLNAFKNNRSTFWKESGGRLRGKGVDTKDPMVWGWVDILSLKTLEGNDLTNSIQFIQPDDDNADDQTVAAVKLKNPVLPGESLTLNIEFRSKLPKIFARTGFSDNYFLVAQWFPKIGVYEPAGMRYAEKGQWNCHQFHAHSEFYANFGVYRVEITLPEEFVVGATGKRISEKTVEDGLKQVTYLAEDVVDFAWTASPRFFVVEDKWKDVDIKVYLQPEHEQLASQHIISLKAALEYFDAHLGSYPYSTISVVDPPFRGMGSAGMEYPTFITAGSFWGLPDELRVTEMVTIHEFGHNYFMGILATNEFEEAWMDEGMNTYFESRIMDHAYGEGTSFVGFKKFHFGDKEYHRLSYTRLSYPKIAESTRPSWKFEHGGYGSMSYNKPATMFTTLERLVGEKTNEEIWKTYFEKWKFKHPSGRDFINVVNEVVIKNHGTRFGENMNW
ncbi:MAG: M1 family metallopeptidase, partial [Bacteroidales bacterium]|nr:M1 family metallopeptidase [Bacteroidales bacterium]